MSSRMPGPKYRDPQITPADIEAATRGGIVITPTGTEKPPTFMLDGFEFYPCTLPEAPLIYLAHRARTGDEAAKAILDSIAKRQAIEIKDANRKQYWPMIEEDAPSKPISDADIEE